MLSREVGLGCLVFLALVTQAPSALSASDVRREPDPKTDYLGRPPPKDPHSAAVRRLQASGFHGANLTPDMLSKLEDRLPRVCAQYLFDHPRDSRALMSDLGSGDASVWGRWIRALFPGVSFSARDAARVRDLIVYMPGNHGRRLQIEGAFFKLSGKTLSQQMREDTDGKPPKESEDDEDHCWRTEGVSLNLRCPKDSE